MCTVSIWFRYPTRVFTATIVSRLHFLGAKVAGVYIALFGGLLTAFNLALSALVLWVISYPGIAQEVGVLRALYYVVFSVGGVGYSVPLGLLFAGVSVPSGFMTLLSKWVVIFGMLLAVCGELSWLSLILPKLLYLIPLTRFPGFAFRLHFSRTILQQLSPINQCRSYGDLTSAEHARMSENAPGAKKSYCY